MIIRTPSEDKSAPLGLGLAACLCPWQTWQVAQSEVACSIRRCAESTWRTRHAQTGQILRPASQNSQC
eukprot:4843898-Pyramimonas_sp.AAC.1